MYLNLHAPKKRYINTNIQINNTIIVLLSNQLEDQ